MLSSDCDMMNYDEEDPNPCSPSGPSGRFDITGSSSPIKSWHPGSSGRTKVHQTTQPRSHGWKRPSSRLSPRSPASGDTLMSSPTPLSRAYVSRASRSHQSPSELRQKAANKLRSIERKNRSNAHRPLLDAFTIGTQRGVNDIPTDREEIMAEAVDRRHIRQMNRQWEELLSSVTDDLIEEAEEDNISMDGESLDEDDPSRIYAEYELREEEENADQETSMRSTTSTILPNNDRPTDTLLSSLLIDSSRCPSCSGGDLRSTETLGIECPHCDWALSHSTLQAVDHHFLQHGDRAFHQPILGYNPHIGTNFVCSHPQCDELVCV